MSQTYYALLTVVGEAKLASATASGIPLQFKQMAVGDGGGNLPMPSRSQTALVGEWYRAPLNNLTVDVNNPNQVITELIIPENQGGRWIREMGLYDGEGSLVAVANTPPSYKPQLAEGSGRTQVLRLVLIIANTAAVELKLDTTTVTATRQYVDDAITVAINRLDFKQSVRAASTANLALSGTQTIDGVVLAVGDRVLVKNQDKPAQNGLYVVALGTWPRASDADTNPEVTPGLLVTVEEGNLQGDTLWKLVTDAPLVLGTTALIFADITSGYAPLKSPELITPRRTTTPERSSTSQELANLGYVERSIGNRNSRTSQIYASTILTKDSAGAIFQMCASSIVTVTLPSVAECQQGDTLRFFSNTSYAYRLTVAQSTEFIFKSLLAPVQTLTIAPGESVELSRTDGINWFITGGSLDAKLRNEVTMSAFRAFHSDGQKISSFTFTKVINGTEIFDLLGEYDPAAGTFIPLYDGYYEFFGALHGEPSSTTQASRTLTLYVNGYERIRLQEDTYVANQSTMGGSSGPIRLSAGDVVSLYYHTTIADTIYVHEALSWFAGRRVV